jgi:hypothetical protein
MESGSLFLSRNVVESGLTHLDESDWRTISQFVYREGTRGETATFPSEEKACMWCSVIVTYNTIAVKTLRIEKRSEKPTTVRLRRIRR